MQAVRADLDSLLRFVSWLVLQSLQVGGNWPGHRQEGSADKALLSKACTCPDRLMLQAWVNVVLCLIIM